MIVTKATDESKETVVTNHDQKSLEEMRLNAKYVRALLFVFNHDFSTCQPGIDMDYS
jgi:hypothetical protein